MAADDPSTDLIRVLAVDDHWPFREAARNVVEATPGFAWAGAAGSGAEAILLARECVPDIVIMEIRMPDMDGLEATRQMLAEHPAVAVLLVSAEPLVSPADLLRSGAAAFSRKHEFRPALLRLLDDRRHTSSRSADRP